MRAAQPRYARLFFQRPFLGRWSPSAVRTQLRPRRLVRLASLPSGRNASLITPTCLLLAALLAFAFCPASAFAGPYTPECEQNVTESGKSQSEEEFRSEVEACEASAEQSVLAPLQPDFASFFGGLEVAVAAAGILVIACVVVLAIRRLTSF